MRKLAALGVLLALVAAMAGTEIVTKKGAPLAAAAVPAAHVGYYAGQGFTSGSVGTQGDPVRGATVHLRKAVCHQIVSVRLRTAAAGGKGLMFVRDRDLSDEGSSWLTSAAPVPMPSGLVTQGTWFEVTFRTAGTFPITFGSSDCPGATDAARVTVVASS